MIQSIGQVMLYMDDTKAAMEDAKKKTEADYM